MVVVVVDQEALAVEEVAATRNSHLERANRPDTPQPTCLLEVEVDLVVEVELLEVGADSEEVVVEVVEVDLEVAGVVMVQ